MNWTLPTKTISLLRKYHSKHIGHWTSREIFCTHESLKISWTNPLKCDFSARHDMLKPTYAARSVWPQNTGLCVFYSQADSGRNDSQTVIMGCGTSGAKYQEPSSGIVVFSPLATTKSGWWFQILFWVYSPRSLGKCSNLTLICFRFDETTNYSWIFFASLATIS